METEADGYIDPSASLDHSSTSSTSWLGLFNRGSLGAAAPNLQAGPFLAFLSPTALEGRRHLSIFFHNAQLLLLFFRLFTQGSLLIDGSVEGQYIKLFYF